MYVLSNLSTVRVWRLVPQELGVLLQRASLLHPGLVFQRPTFLKVAARQSNQIKLKKRNTQKFVFSVLVENDAFNH